ncbi:MAG: hypothetical protein GTO53_10525 [Planctomycetales bacterium]|nr:hypothetical protein [Planctomycetales bacterium]NIM09556.1 hypothetical protein [Planctomycetales bacterium]NIN09044.1 hypothetical protein [Planctomycetales bacterium]NIN78157.1 hypothetical protein [Planctomycetales bacterium]NIO35342.1 hypothetical protein [Planctomycetales bacterium]
MMTEFDERYDDNEYDDQARHVPIRQANRLVKKKRPDYCRKRKVVRRGMKQRRLRNLQW